MNSGTKTDLLTTQCTSQSLDQRCLISTNFINELMALIVTDHYIWVQEKLWIVALFRHPVKMGPLDVCQGR